MAQYTRSRNDCKKWNTTGITLMYIERDTEQGTKYVPTMEQLRRLHVAEGDEPSFRCPACCVRFKVSYGVFGNIPLHREYGELQFWCRDCASLNNIHRSRR